MRFLNGYLEAINKVKGGIKMRFRRQGLVCVRKRRRDGISQRYWERHRKVVKISKGKVQLNPNGKTIFEAGVSVNKGIYVNMTDKPIKKTKFGLELSSKGGPSVFAEHRPFRGTKLKSSFGLNGFDTGVEQKITRNTSIETGITPSGRYIGLEHKRRKGRLSI